MSQHRIPVNRIAWIHNLGRSESRRICEQLGYPVSEDGNWVDADAMEAVRASLQTQGEAEISPQVEDDSLSAWAKIWRRLSSRQQNALLRRFTKQLNGQSASEST